MGLNKNYLSNSIEIAKTENSCVSFNLIWLVLQLLHEVFQWIYVLHTRISLYKKTEKSRTFTETFSNPIPYGSQLLTDVSALNIKYQVGSWNTPRQGNVAMVQKT